MSAALLARLIEAGTPADLVGEVAMELARAQALQEQAEIRRAKDRDRKRNPRNSTESTETAEIQNKGSLEVSPHTPLPKPSKITPLSPPKIELPDWLPMEAWADFTAARKKMRNVPFEAGAQKRLIAKLDRLRGEGHCPEKLLSKAVERGYRTVFEGDDTKATRVAVKQSPEEIVAFYERMGMHDDAKDARRKYGLSVGKLATDIVKQVRVAQ